MKTAEIKTFTAWAIKTNDPENLGFIGRYWWFKWWFEETAEHIPEKLEGCRIALFKTKKIARRNLQWVTRAFPEAEVKKVHVAIEEIK